MHRRMRDQVEHVLAGSPDAASAEHLAECEECREALAGMQQQAALLRGLRAPDDAEPRAGFYARVMERIEAQGSESIWSMFFDSALGRRVAMASMGLALCLSVYLVSSEELADRIAPSQQAATVRSTDFMPPSPDVSSPDEFAPDRDAVLVNLVTYRGQ
jgi:predicted anti-sigma-YlaC factor YlaD